ncbi:glycosyltransferase [Aeromicrobium sp. YIM 150415]|uniref:glycosyltransferase family 2 protein n=1 Tax=Aeromicrobium sp. YIM 150415 TaxID=2803912 RepID=UPI001965F3F9|nr:glycosyltransferase [Aeromicrobium sp. YIM 150415]MBM9463423.1 glycosyltransferase [Aeromicrobium sp. YIM 150415]
MTTGSPLRSSKPLVTIISAYYRRAHAVAPTLESIRDQSYDNFNAIIWDDNSPDETWRELDRVAREIGDPRFTVYQHSENLGLTRGFNEAIAKIDSEYIAIVGSGDICHPDRILKQVRALEGDPEAAFCATGSTTTDPIQGTTFFDSSFSSTIITRQDIETTCPFTHGSVMYRSDRLKEIGAFEPTFKWCADWDVFFRLLKKSHAIFIPEVLYMRTAQLDGVSFHPRKAFEQIEFKHLALELSRCSEEQRQTILANVQSDGIPEALPARSGAIARDLARRNVKLYLMKRRRDAIEMSRMAVARGVGYPLKYRAYLRVAALLSHIGFDPNLLIKVARSLPR